MINYFSTKCISVSSGCLTCFCPCITFGLIAEIVDKGNTCKYIVILPIERIDEIHVQINVNCGSIMQLVLLLALVMH